MVYIEDPAVLIRRNNAHFQIVQHNIAEPARTMRCEKAKVLPSYLSGQLLLFIEYSDDRLRVFQKRLLD